MARALPTRQANSSGLVPKQVEERLAELKATEIIDLIRATSDPRWPPSCSTTGTEPGRCQAPSMPPWCPHSSASCSEPTRTSSERWLGSKRRSVESSPDLAALTHQPYASSPDQAANPSQSHAKQVPHLPYTKTAIRPTPLSKAKAPPLNDITHGKAKADSKLASKLASK